MIRVRHAVPPDSWAWLEMRNDLWPGHENKWHAEEIQQFFSGMLKMPLAVLVAEDAAGEIVGFVELNIRPYAEDCLTDRVALLEGWYVKPHARKKGVGKALIEAVYEKAKAAGSPRVYWHTHETNKTAMRLYDHVATHSGFVVYRREI